jgi:hypothetical protein
MSTAVYPILAGGLIDTLTKAMRAEPVEEWPGEAIEEALSLCRQARKMGRGLRRELEESLAHGWEAKSFLTTTGPGADEMGKRLAVLSGLVEDLGRAEQPGGRPLSPAVNDLLQEARAVLQESTDTHRFLLAALAQAAAPPRPVDLNQLRAAAAAYARGETSPFPGLTDESTGG